MLEGLLYLALLLYLLLFLLVLFLILLFIFFQQFPACGFRPENTLVLISHFANSLRIMLSRIPYLPTWANGVTRHGTCSR